MCLSLSTDINFPAKVQKNSELQIRPEKSDLQFSCTLQLFLEIRTNNPGWEKRKATPFPELPFLFKDSSDLI